MSIIGACMVPHPPIILPEIGRGEERKIAETTASYEKAADLVASLKPDTLVIASPHTRMYADWFYIGGGSEGYGSFSQFRAGHVRIHADYDTEMIRALSDAAGREDFPAGPVEDPDIPLDHGVMIPLYFIQKKYSDFKIVRIGISGLPLTDHYRLGMMIRDCAEQLGRRVFFVASGDLSHKLKKDGPYGFIEEGPVYDTRIMDVMGSGDFKKLFAFDSAFCEKAAECGHKPFCMMAGFLDGKKVSSKVYSHEDITGVGYGVCSFTAEGYDPGRKFRTAKLKDEENCVSSLPLSNEPYVRLAQRAIYSRVISGRYIKVPDDVPEQMLQQRAGVFVSIHRYDRLRGCIGTIMPAEECIAEEIIRNAILASTSDSRFYPVKPDELDSLEISVDVLGEIEDISSPDELDVLRYGVIVRNGARRGLLLPNLDGITSVDQQIEIAMQKAGIMPGEKISLQRFEVVRHYQDHGAGNE